MMIMSAETIKLMRTRTKMTQSDLAKKLGITRSAVNAWEMGITVPSTQYLIELSETFNVTTDFLLGIEKENILNIECLSEEQKGIVHSLVNCFSRMNSEIE